MYKKIIKQEEIIYKLEDKIYELEKNLKNNQDNQTLNKEDIIKPITAYIITMVLVQIIGLFLESNINPILNTTFGQMSLISIVNTSLTFIAIPIFSACFLSNIIENKKLQKEEKEILKNIDYLKRNLHLEEDKLDNLIIGIINSQSNTTSKNIDKYYSYSDTKPINEEFQEKNNNSGYTRKRTKNNYERGDNNE